MSVTVTPLDTGLTVISHYMPQVETVALGIWAGAGSRDEKPEEGGLAHLLEHMAFKGTPSRSAFEIAAAQDTPDDLVFDKVQDLAWPDHPLGRDILGTPASVSSLDARHLNAYRERH